MLRADYICIILNFRFISHEIKKQNAITVNGRVRVRVAIIKIQKI